VFAVNVAVRGVSDLVEAFDEPADVTGRVLFHARGAPVKRVDDDEAGPVFVGEGA
jgi:hypothetical protein